MFELHPKTKKLLAAFSGAEYGSTYTYAEILQKTGCDLVEQDRQRIYTVVRRLERDHQRTLLNIRGVGYKVALPGEFVSSMQVRTGRAKRHVALARRTGEAAPRALMNAVEAQSLTDQQAFNAHVVQAFNHQSRWNHTQDERIARIEREIKQWKGAQVDVIEGEAVEEDSGV